MLNVTFLEAAVLVLIKKIKNGIRVIWIFLHSKVQVITLL